jgi:hypothetical protein
MIIDDNPLAVSNCMFRYRNQWQFVTDELKDKYFFLFNRYFSKIYPEKAQLLNDKSIDKITAMNIWYAFMKDKPYPPFFWSKSEKKIEKNLFIEKDLVSLQQRLQITDSEMKILIDFHQDEVKEEIKYIKSQTEK